MVTHRVLTEGLWVYNIREDKAIVQLASTPHCPVSTDILEYHPITTMRPPTIFGLLGLTSVGIVVARHATPSITLPWGVYEARELPEDEEVRLSIDRVL